ncbi:hypothetical protein [Paraburkholderia sp. J10-1]|uniref:hypothetical protein n=1 Tax=Paraburkholderia sp. J10-1 TaxID=2805430 RepID=UPI002AB736A3|nr:hypothetical protein [Paraburkholderia sp. J10-1]
MEDDNTQPRDSSEGKGASPIQDIGMALTATLADVAASQMFNFVFDSWEPNSLHWPAPSSLSIQWDGSWSFFAAHLANMRRTGGFFDTGTTFNFGLTLSFYDVDVPLHASHAPIYTTNIGIASLDYKNSADNVVKNGLDPRIAELAAQIVSANCIQTMST